MRISSSSPGHGWRRFVRVQLAARRGSTVIATGLPEDEEWIRGLLTLAAIA